MSFLRPLATSVFAASLISLSACGGSSSSSPAYTVPADADLVVKAVPSIRWDAAEYTATAGDINVFVANEDNAKHILVIREGDKVVGDLQLTIAKKGDVDEGSINLLPGSYFVYCIVPGHSNMKSTLTVS
jgi:plastocyanin